MRFWIVDADPVVAGKRSVTAIKSIFVKSSTMLRRNAIYWSIVIKFEGGVRIIVSLGAW